MKKFIVPVVCALVGCAAGAAMPAVTAQTFGAPSSGAGTYEAFCEDFGRSRNLSELVARHGRSGFHLTDTGYIHGSYACFERPAQ